jgi:hypothetical protein
LSARNAFEEKLNKAIQLRQNFRTQSSDTILTIPIVVHVVYNVNHPEQNISDAQILSQIPVLNEDYRRMMGTNGYNPLGVDIGIEFCLANISPSGNDTIGITRHPTTIDGFNIIDPTGDSTLKSNGYWPADQYLNIWLANLNGFLGYTQFPDSTGLPGLDQSYNTAYTDGVSIGPQFFGRQTGTATNAKYNLGRTASHEIGHWLGLKHTWGDGTDCSATDYCDDTPACSGLYFSSYASNCPAPIQCGNTPRQVQNYLDYSDDPCMSMFTADQKMRMQTTLSVSPRRIALKNSLGCSGTVSGFATNVLPDSTLVSFYPNPTEGYLIFESLKPFECTIYNIQGVNVFNSTVGSGTNTISFELAQGVYIVQTNSTRKKLMIK